MVGDIFRAELTKLSTIRRMRLRRRVYGACDFYLGLSMLLAALDIHIPYQDYLLSEPFQQISLPNTWSVETWKYIHPVTLVCARYFARGAKSFVCRKENSPGNLANIATTFPSTRTASVDWMFSSSVVSPRNYGSISPKPCVRLAQHPAPTAGLRQKQRDPWMRLSQRRPSAGS